MRSRRRPRGLWPIALGAGLAALATFLMVSPAFAHGKEVTIKLSCRASQPSAPLERTCRATVVATNDGDPILDARLTLTATRPAKSDSGFEPVSFSPDTSEGEYVASFILPAYGSWEFHVEIEKPAEGKVDLRQEILPPSGSDSPASQAEVRLLRGFDLRDLANLLLLGFHLVGTMLVLGANLAIVLLATFLDGPEGTRIRRSAVRLFPWVTLASFVLLAVSGAYNAAYNSPSSSPGLYEPRRVASLPFGDAYVATFGLKMVLAGALLAGTAALAVVLKRTPSWQVAPIGGAANVDQGRVLERLVRSRDETLKMGDAKMRERAIFLVSFANLVDGLAILVIVLVMDYLHLLSHAQVPGVS